MASPRIGAWLEAPPPTAFSALSSAISKHLTALVMVYLIDLVHALWSRVAGTLMSSDVSMPGHNAWVENCPLSGISRDGREEILVHGRPFDG